MLRHNAKAIVATAGVVTMLGAGVAVAAAPPTCPYGHTPKVTQTQSKDTTQQRLRKRDGTGPRHAQRVQQRDRQHQSDRQQGTGNPSCPYRS